MNPLENRTRIALRELAESVPVREIRTEDVVIARQGSVAEHGPPGEQHRTLTVRLLVGAAVVLSAAAASVLLIARDPNGGEPGPATQPSQPMPGTAPAIDHVRLQQEGARLSEALTELAPDLFGGRWFGLDERLKIGLTRATPEATELIASSPYAASIDAVIVEHSQQELESGNEWLAQELAELGDPQVSAGIDSSSNAVVLDVPVSEERTEAQSNLIERAQQRLGGLLIVREHGKDDGGTPATV